MESARFAKKNDIPFFLDLYKKHLSAITDSRGAELLKNFELPSSSELEVQLGEHINHKNHLVLAGTFDDVIFGFLHGSVAYTSTEEKIGQINQVIVFDEAREVGIGEAMMNLAVEGLYDLGCISIDVKSLPGDRQTKNFFESFGFKARMLVLNRKL